MSLLQTHQTRFGDGSRHVRKSCTLALLLSLVAEQSFPLSTLCLGNVCCCSTKRQHHVVYVGCNQWPNTLLAHDELRTGRSTVRWQSSEHTPLDHTHSEVSLPSHSTHCKTASNVHTSTQLHLVLEAVLRWLQYR